MALQFGTSGVRGLVSDFTETALQSYVDGFLRLIEADYPELAARREFLISGDFRDSTPDLIGRTAAFATSRGYRPVFSGIVPTPALAWACALTNLPGIMVTGSHIPEDRNGLKFYLPSGEILKNHEARITEYANSFSVRAGSQSLKRVELKDIETFPADQKFLARYLEAFSNRPLQGMKIAFYAHSSCARTVLPQILEGLGARVDSFGHSERFIPVDTESVQSLKHLGNTVREMNADALVSTDGDADRPLFIDDLGEFVPGDILCTIAAKQLGIKNIAIPVSCNTGIDQSGWFSKVIRTKIGSPFVLGELLAMATTSSEPCAGFEANGGFLLGSPTKNSLSPLFTRDSILPIVATLIRAKEQKKTVSQLRRELPSRFTESELVKNCPIETSKRILLSLRETAPTQLPTRKDVNETDGFRIYHQDGSILHFRPSGNAPEFRIYAEADSPKKAIQLALAGKEWVGAQIERH